VDLYKFFYALISAGKTKNLHVESFYRRSILAILTAKLPSIKRVDLSSRRYIYIVLDEL